MNAGLSVSRVGGDAQVKAMKQIAGTLRMELAQYRELEAFSQFASDLDPATQKQLARGERLMRLLRQAQYQPLSIVKQIISIFAGTNGFVDEYPVGTVSRYESELHEFLDARHKTYMEKLGKAGAFNDELRAELNKILEVFKERFKSE
jgi:F-type H+-transporting ATPase subunit alpha